MTRRGGPKKKPLAIIKLHGSHHLYRRKDRDLQLSASMTALCRYCGASLKVSHRGPPRQFCNARCRYRFHRPKRSKKDRTRTCFQCGRNYRSKRRGKPGKYCSPACSQEASIGKKHKLSLVTQKCAKCGAEFIRYANANNQQWCGACSRNRRASAEHLRSARRLQTRSLPRPVGKVKEAPAVATSSQRAKSKCYTGRQATLQKIWEQKLKKALAVDREAALKKTASRLLRTLNQSPRQWIIYDLVCNWGIPERIVAEKLGISQQGVSRVLRKVLDKFPGLMPTPRERKSSEPLPDGFHRPGKTRLGGCNRAYR